MTRSAVRRLVIVTVPARFASRQGLGAYDPRNEKKSYVFEKVGLIK